MQCSHVPVSLLEAANVPEPYTSAGGGIRLCVKTQTHQRNEHDSYLYLRIVNLGAQQGIGEPGFFGKE